MLFCCLVRGGGICSALEILSHQHMDSEKLGLLVCGDAIKIAAILASSRLITMFNTTLKFPFFGLGKFLLCDSFHENSVGQIVSKGLKCWPYE